MKQILKACAGLAGALGIVMSFGGCQFDPFDSGGGFGAITVILLLGAALANVLVSFGNILGGG
jgi:hypothetical protein